MRQTLKIVLVLALVGIGLFLANSTTHSSGIASPDVRSFFACTPIPITLGESVNGNLATGDCVETNSTLYDGYTFAGTVGESVNISLTSEAFVPVLRLVQGSFPGGAVVATGADAGAGTRRIVNFTIPASGTFTIVAGSTASTGGYSLSFEPTIPRVDLIQRTSPNPAVPGSIVGYTVFLSSAVTGVDTADFTLTTTGLSGAVVSSVSGSGSIYSIAVNSGSGTGSLRLDLIDNDTIINGLGTPLGGVGAGNGNFNTGPSYTIAAPTPTPSPTVPPNTVIVTNTNDSGSGSLRQAISDVVSGGNIQFSTLFNSSQTITLSSGELRVTRPVTITGPGQNLLTISANNTSRVFNLGGSSPVIPITISGMTITGGRAPENDFGGGIESNFISLTLNDCTIAGNSAPGTDTLGGGGGIDSFEGAVTISNSTITANQANQSGGGILSASGPLTITGSVITLNQTFSTQGTGGGVAASGGGTVTITDSIIQGNQTSLTGGFGGGIHVSDNSRLNLSVSTVRSNSAANGGGISIANGSTGAILNSTINGNTAASQGGGVFVRNSNTSFTSSTISGNAANNPTTAGGALILDATSGSRTVDFTNCTIAANTASQNVGGGIVLFARSVASANATVRLRNTIAANNTGPNIRSLSENGAFSTVVSQGFNLTNDGGSGFLNQPTDKLNAEPGIGPLADNGGPTRTHSLLVSSAAIDAGNSSGSTTDQRGAGFLRIIDLAAPNPPGGDGSDIGAFEAQTPPVSSVAVISGRVLRPGGNAIGNSRVFLTDQQGSRLIATTSNFGIFTFQNVPTGQTYFLTVASKRYRFAPQTLVVNADITGLDLLALE